MKILSIHLLRKSLEFDLSFIQTTKEIVFFSKVLDTFVKINKFDNVWLPIFVMLNTSQRITMFFRFQKSDQKESRYYRFTVKTIHILCQQKYWVGGWVGESRKWPV